MVTTKLAWHINDVEYAASSCDTSMENGIYAAHLLFPGLTEEVATQRGQLYGPNELSGDEGSPFPLLIYKQVLLNL